jgi:F420-non-reducing hydrogenase large subunit
MIGGRKVHPCTSIPGGLTKGITEAQRVEIEQMGRWSVDFALFSLKLFNDIVLGNSAYVDLILGDIFTHRTYYIGTVDANNWVNFYDGRVSVMDYTDWIAERVEPWTYLKFPYLKKVGWKGLVDGKDSGVYMATPLSRLNAADGMATPRAQEEYERFYATLLKKEGGSSNGTGPGHVVHQRLATHWARLIELLYAAERWVELATDPEITSDKFHTVPTEKPTEGVGIVEAPRGLLTRVNLIVGTTNNYAPISMSIKKAAQSLIHKGTVIHEGLLNRVEMAFRAYDPCFGCATHSFPGQMPLEVVIRDACGEPVEVLRQNCD